MTLLVAVGNPRSTVVVSDGRLTFDGHVLDDEHTKASIVWSSGARSVAAYTGLARAGRFRTDEWLVGALESSMSRAGVLDLSLLASAASSAFARLQSPAVHNRLTVVLAGYVADAVHTYPAGWVSNFEAPSGLSLTHAPGETFGQVFMRHTIPEAFEASYVILAGTTAAVDGSARERLRQMAAEDLPAFALRDQAVELIRLAADSPVSRNAVGKECVSVVLPSDATAAPQSTYHSTRPVNTIRLPNMIAPGIQAIDARLDVGGPPTFAGVGRNERCPCGSGRKYKKCHGRL